MAEMTSLSPAYEVSPVLAGFLGAGVLVVAVTAVVFLWALCQRQYRRASSKLSADPPLSFIHMLKGVGIYPESPSHAHKVARPAGGSSPWRRARDPPPPERAPPARARYCCSDEGGSGGSPEAPPPTSPDTPPLGSLDLGVEYSAERRALAVTIAGARGLPAASDPYVTMSVLPEAKHRVRTRVMRRSLAPAFRETFTFYGVAPGSLAGLTLHFLVLSYDRFARHRLIGEVLVPLVGVELGEGGRADISRCITRRNPQDTRGELLVSLSCHPTTHRLNVVVLKAKHLPTMDITGLPGNPYVKVSVFYGRRRIGRRKTRVRRCTLEPVFDESFAFDVPAELMADVSVEFLLLDSERHARHAPVGRLVLGGQSPTPSGATHWREVCDNPRRQIAKWHDLSEF